MHGNQTGNYCLYFATVLQLMTKAEQRMNSSQFTCTSLTYMVWQHNNSHLVPSYSQHSKVEKHIWAFKRFLWRCSVNLDLKSCWCSYRNAKTYRRWKSRSGPSAIPSNERLCNNLILVIIFLKYNFYWQAINNIGHASKKRKVVLKLAVHQAAVCYNSFIQVAYTQCNDGQTTHLSTAERRL